MSVTKACEIEKLAYVALEIGPPEAKVTYGTILEIDIVSFEIDIAKHGLERCTSGSCAYKSACLVRRDSDDRGLGIILVRHCELVIPDLNKVWTRGVGEGLGEGGFCGWR